MQTMTRAALAAAACALCGMTANSIAQAPPYAGESPAEFAALATRLGKSDWPAPATIGYFDPEGGAAKTIRYARWAPVSSQPLGVVVHFNGRTEFIERNIYTYRDLTQRGYEVWTLDWRGQGFSVRELEDKQRNHIESFDEYVKDAAYFLDHVVRIKQASGKRILLAHSMGGQIALRLVLSEPGKALFDQVLLSSPLLKVPKDSGSVRFGNGVKRFFGFGDACVWEKAPSWSSNFTQPACALVGSGTLETVLADRKETEQYSHDFLKLAELDCMVESSRDARGASAPDLRVACPTSAWLHAAHGSTDQVLEHAHELQTPTLMVRTLPDTAVDNQGQDVFCQRAAPVAKCIDVKAVDGVPVGHELLIEKNAVRQLVLMYLDGL